MVTLAPPGSTVEVRFENQTMVGQEPTNDDVELLHRQLFASIAGSDSWLLDLFREAWPVILNGLRVAKHELSGAFTGMFAGDGEIGLQLIRPGYVLRTTGATETPQNDWNFTFTADSDYWIGFGTNNTTAMNVDKRLCLVPLGVRWFQAGSPTVEELYFQIGGTTYPVNVISHGWNGDNLYRERAARIRPMIWKPKETVIGQVYSILASTDQRMQLVGVAFGKGDLLRTQEPSTIQT